MVLGKLPVPGRPTNLGKSRARAYCACSGCAWGLFRHFFSRISFLISFSLSLEDGPILTEILLKGPLSQTQPTMTVEVKCVLLFNKNSYTLLRTGWLFGV